MVSELRRWVMMYKKWNALKKSWKATRQDRPQEMQMFSIMGITSSFSCVSPWARTYRFALLLCCIEYRSWYIKDLRLLGYGTYLVQSKHCSLIRKSRFWPKKKRVSYYVSTFLSNTPDKTHFIISSASQKNISTPGCVFCFLRLSKTMINLWRRFWKGNKKSLW